MKHVVAACLVGCFGIAAARAATDGQSFDQIERGRYLATLGDCAACHTATGGPDYAGGKAIETPFGALLAANITPDRDTGIGTWTDDEFVAVLQDGVGKGGERLYPAMPYPYYTKVTRDDALAMRAWLNTLAPVHNDVKSNQLPFPFDIRASMIAWDQMFFTKGQFTPVAGKSEEWNRGAYLVQGLGHCAACHTPKNMLGGDQTSKVVQGGVIQGWFAPDLTGDTRTGLGKWSEDDIIAYLKTGQNRMTAATGPMAEVIADSTSRMTDADLKAMAVYLKDVPPGGVAAPAPVSNQNSAMQAGQAIYIDNCAACHAAGGDGVPHLFPALKASQAVQSAEPTSLIRVVLQGTRSVATDAAPTSPAMPTFGWKLSDAQIAAVVTYMRNSWGNAASAVSASQVKSARQSLAAD